MCEGYTAQESAGICCAVLSVGSRDGCISYYDGKKVPLKSSPKTIANQKTRVLKKLGLANQKDLRHVFDMFRENGEND